MQRTEEQAELFDSEHADVGVLFDGLDKIPSEELQNRWPQLLVDLIDLMEAELLRQQFAKKEAKSTACKLVGVMAHYFGGQSVYLPSGSKIKDALRDVNIYHDFNGKNIPELIKKYRLSERAIYDILRQQRNRQRTRHQMDLFVSERLV